MRTCHTFYALRVLRSHGMNDFALQTVFRSVIIAKIQYASSAWWGFSTATERHHIDAFISRSARCRFVPRGLPSFESLCRTAQPTKNCSRTLRLTTSTCSASILSVTVARVARVARLQSPPTQLELPGRISHLTDCMFITRMLYADIYLYIAILAT